MAGPTASNSRPGVPTWARGAANYIFGDVEGFEGQTGMLGEAQQGAAAFDFPGLMAMLGAPLDAANLAGSAQREMGAGLTNQAVGNTTGIANQSQAGAGGIMDMLAQIPGFEGAAVALSQNINRGAGGLQNALGSANQTMQNVMNPTAYNPLYQNAMANQIRPTIDASFSSRGLGSSGAAVEATSQAGQNLSDQFAQRQFQEQMGAQANVGNISNTLGQLGVAGAQVPGAVLNQFMGAMNTGQQGLGTAMQNQLGPLGALTAGSQQVWEGINNPMNAIAQIYGLSRQPMANLMGGVTGVTGGMSSPHVGPMQTALGK